MWPSNIRDNERGVDQDNASTYRWKIDARFDVVQFDFSADWNCALLYIIQPVRSNCWAGISAVIHWRRSSYSNKIAVVGQQLSVLYANEYPQQNAGSRPYNLMNAFAHQVSHD